MSTNAEIERKLDGIAEQLAELNARVTAVWDTRPLLSVADAARRLNISQKSVWNYVGEGKLPAVWIGEGRRMIEAAALDAYIAERRGLTNATDSE